jgi:two-component system, LytTR family, response regulator
MQLKCIAIDDEPLALDLIKNYVSRMPALQLLHTFDDALTGAEFLNNGTVDLLFVDINMPDITGVELVRSLEQRPMVIFTTAYKNYAYEGFELEAIDYLLKPIDFNRFSKAVEKAIEYHKYKTAAAEDDTGSLYVYSEYRMVKIDLKDIEYIESMEDYVKIHQQNQPTILTLMPLKKILEKLPANQFQRIHRSYAVAVNKVKAIQNRKAHVGDVQLPISDSYTDFIKSWGKK